MFTTFFLRSRCMYNFCATSSKIKISKKKIVEYDSSLPATLQNMKKKVLIKSKDLKNLSQNVYENIKTKF